MAGGTPANPAALVGGVDILQPRDLAGQLNQRKRTGWIRPVDGPCGCSLRLECSADLYAWDVSR